MLLQPDQDIHIRVSALPLDISKGLTSIAVDRTCGQCLLLSKPV